MRLLLESTVLDLRYALRGLRKNPGFAVTAVAAMALGIGANTAIFSIVNAVLLKPPFPDSDRLVVPETITVSETGGVDEMPIASPATFVHWRAQSNVLQDVSAFMPGALNYSGGEVVEQWASMQTSAGGFRCLGIPVLQGRGFTREEELPNGPRVALLSEGLWKRRFAGDPRILGKKISLSEEPYTVIGIVADGAGLGFSNFLTEVYVPFRIDPATADQGHSFFAGARLKPGVTFEQARERLQASAAEYRAKFPGVLGPKDGFTLKPIRELLASVFRSLLLLLTGAVGLVLLIACANVANLLLARATRRRREIGIRVALGGGRARMIRQLLTESVLLSFAGGALGLALGHVGIRALLASNPAFMPLGDNGDAVVIDWRVVGFALTVSLLTGILFGLLPALQSSRVDLTTALKDTGGRGGTGLWQNRICGGLVVIEVSLAMILLVGSALLIRTFVELYKVDRGFEAKNVMTMRTSLSRPMYVKTKLLAGTIRNAAERTRALPGVVDVTATCCVPLQGNYTLEFDIAGRPPVSGQHSGDGGWSTISPGYFNVLQIPVKRGRVFTNRDDGLAPAVVVINETMAKKYWKDGDPLKDRIVIGRGLDKKYDAEPVRQIVGVVGDVRDQGLSSIPRPMMYVPQAQLPDALNADFFQPPMAWIVRTQARSPGLVAAIQKELRQSTGLPVSDVLSMEDVVRNSAGQERFNMLVMTVFGGSALFLAAIGIYGLMAYSVEQRRQEIGIRLALGAEAGQVKAMVVWQGMRLALAGVIIGGGAALGLMQVLSSLLFGVQARDPLVFATVPIVLSVVAVVAVWAPASRASKVDPIESLRYE